jgi:hypothetical protein
MAKQFTSKTNLTNVRKENNMMIASVPYGDWVLSNEDAFKLAEIFSRSERYREKYRTNAPNTHHVYPQEGKMGMFVISDDMYRMAKLAGEPKDD